MRMKSKMAANLVFQAGEKAKGFFLRCCPLFSKRRLLPVHFYIHLIISTVTWPLLNAKKSEKVSVLAFEPLC